MYIKAGSEQCSVVGVYEWAFRFHKSR